MSSPAQTQPPGNAPDNGIDADDVARYLRQQPRYFADHPELLDGLQLPHGPQGTLSLIEHQVRRLRGERDRLRDQLAQLIQVAEANHGTQARFHQLHLRLLEAADLEGLWSTLEAALCSDFGADCLALALPDLEPAEGLLRRRPYDLAEAAPFAQLLSSGQPLCGRLTAAQGEYLFGSGTAAGIASAVVLPLAADHRQGLLGLGSTELDRYQPDLDTGYLAQLGEFLGALYLRLRR